jgi:hypothetical protein
VTENPAVLCSPNGAFKAITRHDIHSTWNLPYPMRFPHPYPFHYPFPDNRDPSQAPPPNTPNPAALFAGF